MNKWNKKHTKFCFITGILSLSLFLVTCTITEYLYYKNKKCVSENYQVEEAEILEKHFHTSVRGNSIHYDLTGRTTDGLVQDYYVRENVYKEKEIGDTFLIYTYQQYRESTLSMLISSSAGSVYQFTRIIAIFSFSFFIGLIGIGLWNTGKERIKRNRQHRHTYDFSSGRPRR